MSNTAGANGPNRATPNLASNLLAIGLGLALLGIAAAYAIDAVSRTLGEQPHRRDSDTILSRTVGGHQLAIPRSWFRHPEDQPEGFSEQIALALQLPLGAAGITTVELTLLPASRIRPSARLLDAVYLHQFTSEQLAGPVGLVGKPLRPSGGFEGETVWYDPLSPDPFVAKCSAPVITGGSSRCLRTIHPSPGLAVVTIFDADLLTTWRDFDAALETRLAQIGL